MKFDPEIVNYDPPANEDETLEDTVSELDNSILTSPKLAELNDGYPLDEFYRYSL